jgi:DNA-binding response OmpR family regulator
VVEIKKSILIVEDDIDVSEMLDAYFRVQGYEVTTVNWGEDAIKSSHIKRPDLVILDIRLPDIDGFEVARQLRETRRTEDVPIIFLTEKQGRLDILQGLKLGADDYITKPFDIQELRLRVRNSLKRITQGGINNPITSLPEGALVDEKFSECLENRNWAIIGISIDNLDKFREMYGFVASDDVLRAVSLMISNAVRNVGGASDFIGHLETYKFVVVTTIDTIQNLSNQLKTRLEQSLDYFYPLKDRVEDMQGSENRLALRLQVLDSNVGSFSDISQLKKSLQEG